MHALQIRLVTRPSHRPVFDCFQYVKTVRDQKQSVGSPGNKANLQRMQWKLSSPSMLSWFLSPRAEFYLKR